MGWPTSPLGASVPLIGAGPEARAYARVRESVRVALGGPRYQQLVEQGVTTSYEDAVAWARHEFATFVADRTT